ncbi:MAG: DUF3467 domain-containing protein [Bacteroidetes bacterium]|nr:DUF3467 domain-containing protein [Bacteroidota bacterium]
MQNQPTDSENQLNIELPEEIAGGIYANLAIIAHSPSEFVLDFVNVMPGMPKGKVRSRIIMTPEHSKRLLIALRDNIARYEQSFGEIKNAPSESGDGNAFPFPFGGPQGMA